MRIAAATGTPAADRGAADEPEVLTLPRRWARGHKLAIARMAQAEPDSWIHVQYQTAAYRMNPEVNRSPAAWAARGLRVAWTYHDLLPPYLFPLAGNALRQRVTLAPGRASRIVVSTNREDEVNHSRALPRRLEAEILLDAISRVTGIEEAFAVHEYVGGGTEPKGTRAIELVPEVTPSQFLEVYGRPVSRDSMPWRDYRSTLRQALHLLVGSTYTTKIAAKGGRVSRLLSAGASDREIVRELYLAALSRFPTAEEETRLLALIEGAASRRKGVENLAWGLLASRQFTYNH